MRLKINHTSVYTYDEPVQYSLQRLRLTPKTQPGQTVLDWRTTVHGAHVEVGYADHFGNHVDLVSMNADQTTIRIVAEGEVETEDRSGVFGPHQGFVPLWLYLRDTPLTKAGRLVRELARTAEGETELARMHALMATLHKAVDYKAGETAADTTAERALEKGSGVCQDHTHIMISAARVLGLPARYVSGYLLMDGHVEQAASHAWADVHIQGLGWVGFDAANNICPDDRYVRLATGLCYRDAAPVSGLVLGRSAETMSVSIRVEASGQSQSQSQS
ncbi:transglutaminase-like putative cysteine protease [Rhizobium subbaraonis]|uniref:Transglutaminase-like putative cysteine protease n=1 Tax=Rhizobium subbaraonis TaxID=908946 RepID=A0A285UKX2_9HYPH|nr:transglutaminase family protein [Rhizobium subbaraonis]SOC42038.1 transglutaminase-like putative cysteine protease [Rhizobium subbaraonis]